MFLRLQVFEDLGGTSTLPRIASAPSESDRMWVADRRPEPLSDFPRTSMETRQALASLTARTTRPSPIQMALIVFGSGFGNIVWTWRSYPGRGGRRAT